MSRLLSSRKDIFTRLRARLMIWFLRELYTSLAWLYDCVAALVSLGRWQEWVLAILPYAAAQPVLELGCGPGHLQVALRRRSTTSFGIDSSRQMCRLARNNLRKTGLPPGMVRADAEAVPFQDEAFARILSTFPAPYIFSSGTAGEVYRLLKPGGLLVVLLAVRFNGASLAEKSTRLLFRWTNQQPPEDEVIERLLAPYRQAGFITRYEWQLTGKDDLLFLLMNKPTSTLNDSEIES